MQAAITSCDIITLSLNSDINTRTSPLQINNVDSIHNKNALQENHLISVAALFVIWNVYRDWEAPVCIVDHLYIK